MPELVDDKSPLPIPHKRFFQIGEVSVLCDVQPHVLRYWEQEFPQLRPVKRRGNRRYYQRDDVLVARQIKTLLYVEGFTIPGARKKLSQATAATPSQPIASEAAQPTDASHAIQELSGIQTVYDTGNKKFVNLAGDAAGKNAVRAEDIAILTREVQDIIKLLD